MYGGLGIHYSPTIEIMGADFRHSTPSEAHMVNVLTGITQYSTYTTQNFSQDTICRYCIKGAARGLLNVALISPQIRADVRARLGHTELILCQYFTISAR